MDKNTTRELHTGNRIPVIGMGSWGLTQDTADTVAYALNIGYRLIDTSSDYGSQPGIGEGFRKSGINRELLYLTTKVEETDDAYERTQSNLKELGMDYVDLTLIHRPPENSAGEELWESLIMARDDGLTRDIGVSNYTIQQMEQLIKVSGETPVVNEIEWSPFGHSDEMATYCREKRIIIIAYSPLTHAKRLSSPELAQLAAKYGKSTSQILLRWNLQRGSIPIPKANKKEHLEENLDVFDFSIAEADMELLNSLNEAYSSLGRLPYL